jgi:AcrR family transcriptional regulator
MPKAFSEQEKETIRAQMREKGKKLFEKQGLKKTSVDELTEAVGISKGAFYLFFDSKEELYLEILEQIEDDVQSRIMEFVIHPKADARKNLRDMLKSFLLTMDAHPLLKNFSMVEYDYLVRKIPAKRVQEHANSDREFTNEFIKKIKSEGITVKASPRVVSNLIKALFFMGLHRDEIGRDDYEELMETLIDLIAGYMAGQ